MFFEPSSPDGARADAAPAANSGSAPQRRALLRLCAAVLGIALPFLAAEILVRVLHATGKLRLERPDRSEDEEFVRAWMEWSREHDGLLINPWLRYDARLGWIPEPRLRDFRFDDFPPVSTNARSMRGVRTYPQLPAAGVTRVVVVGDSYTFGFSATDEQVWTRILEESLHDAEVLNLAVPGYGTDQMMLRLERDGIPRKPDIIIAAVYEDDVNRNLLTFRENAKPRLSVRNGKLVVGNVPVPTAEQIQTRYGYRPPLSYALHLARGRIRSRTAPPDDTERIRERDELSGAILARMARLAAEADARFLVVYIPRHVDALFQEDPVREHMLAEAARTGFELLDLTPVLSDAVREYDRSPYTDHFNLFGQLLAAEAGRTRLIAEGWVPMPEPDRCDLRARIEAEGRAEAQAVADHLGQARMMLGLSRPDEAVVQFRLAILKGADRGDVHAELALVLDEANRTAESVEHFRRAIELDPGNPETLNNFGVALDRLGRSAEAEARLNEAIRLAPTHAAARFNLAQVMLGRGDRTAAVGHLRAALELDPDFEAARSLLSHLIQSPAAAP